MTITDLKVSVVLSHSGHKNGKRKKSPIAKAITNPVREKRKQSLTARRESQQAQENHSPIVCRAKSITNRKRGKTISHRSQALGLQVMNDNNWKLMVFMRMC